MCIRDSPCRSTYEELTSKVGPYNREEESLPCPQAVDDPDQLPTDSDDGIVTGEDDDDDVSPLPDRSRNPSASPPEPDDDVPENDGHEPVAADGDPPLAPSAAVPAPKRKRGRPFGSGKWNAPPRAGSRRPPNIPIPMWEHLNPAEKRRIRAEQTVFAEHQTETLARAAAANLSSIKSILASYTQTPLNEKDVNNTTKATRRIVEFACGTNSLIGKHATSECEVVRLTADLDLTTREGLRTAIKAVSVPNTLLWISIPCTGGCWYNQMYNDKHASHKQRMKDYEQHFLLSLIHISEPTRPY